jgi:hypothetical protein
VSEHIAPKAVEKNALALPLLSREAMVPKYLRKTGDLFDSIETNWGT